MTPTPTVERVARAIEDKIQAALPSVYVHSMDYEYAARAAIEAMEPLIGKTLVDAALGRGGVWMVGTRKLGVIEIAQMAAALRADNERILSEMETVPMGWQPIESAPKDGTFLILYCAEDKSTWWASWQSYGWYGCDEHGLTREGHNAGDPNAVTGWFVTHWMPLPAPPEGGK